MENIYKKLSKITNELTIVAKNLSINIGKSSYKAVGEADVLSAVKPLEEKYGVYSYPVSRKIIESTVFEDDNKRTYFERIEVVYRFVNIDDSEDYIEIVSYGDGIDSGDKSVGKAMTYADKYALLKAYKIITGDDPDQFASEKVVDDKPMTQQQKDLIIKLFNEKDVIPNKVYDTLKIDRKHVSKTQASELIDYLMKQPQKKASYTAKEIASTVNDVRIEAKVEQNDDEIVDDVLPF